MNLPKSILLVSFCLTILFANSQDFPGQFKKLQEQNDTTGQLQLLNKWEAKDPRDPEMFIAYFNYYTNLSMTEMISVDSKLLRTKQYFKPEIVKKGFEYIDKGILLYPTRLDMRFGKIYMFGKTDNFEAFTKYIISTIDYGHSINDAWTWKEGKPLDDAKEFFAGSIQDYIGTIYNTEDDNLLPLMREISMAVLKYNPTHVESLANVALTYLIVGDYEKALVPLLKAETIAPKDVIVLNNIAQAYIRKKDNTNAKIYLEKIIQSGNSEEIKLAKQQIKELKN